MRSRVVRTALPWLGIVALGALAAWLRYGVVESPAMAMTCAAAQGPWWCAARQGIVLGFLYNVYGIAALLAAAWALVVRGVLASSVAAALGLFALELYGFQSGALALLVGSLCLLGAQARPEPTAQDRPRQGQVQPQP
ncbi:MAG: hypothetical protein ABI300_05380 [Rhodanobacter sp.]